jgi:diguanylate cyclase (GGDEF)-like protein
VVTKSRNLNYDCVVEFGKGIIGSAVNKPAGFITGNLKSYTGDLEYYSHPENINSMMIMRVMDNQSKRIQGLLLVDSENVRAFNDEHKELMYRFTQIASAMITSAKLTYQMNRYAIQADTQYEISKKLSEALKPEEVIDTLTQSVMKTFEHNRVVICAYNPATSKGTVWRVLGDKGSLAEGMEFDIQSDRSLYGSVFRNRRAMVTQGFRLEKRFVRFDREEAPEERPQDILIAPIHDDRQAVWAVVGIESNRDGTYSQPELQLLKTIMANVTTALTKARMYTEMEKLATIDGLTQIANHRKFQDIMTMEMERSGRYNTPLTLLLMDIDHFKKFNDTYGHPVGDLVLQMVAKALQGSIRNTDYCARYGGEEFVVVLIQADEAQARILAERIRKSVESLQIQNEDKILRVTVSIGSATFPYDGGTKQEIIDNADKAMYFSKQNGRNRVSFYSSVRQAAAPQVAQPSRH